MKDTGCIETLFPVASALIKTGVSVRIFLDSRSMAEERIADNKLEELGIPRFSGEIEEDCTFVTCLPLEEGFDFVAKNRGKISKLVLVQEVVEEVTDGSRTMEWLKLSPDVACVLNEQAVASVKEANSSTSVAITGLPAIDRSAKETQDVDVSAIEVLMGINEQRPLLFVSFPGDREGCFALLKLITPILESVSTDLTLVPRFHPKFKRDDSSGYEEILLLIEALQCPKVSVDKVAKLSPHEFLALSKCGHFVAPFDSTMLWQANVAGACQTWIPCYKGLPGSEAEMRESVLVQGRFARVLKGFYDMCTDEVFEPEHLKVDGKSVKRIAQAIIK